MNNKLIPHLLQKAGSPVDVPDDGGRCLDSGMVALLAKPINRPELTAMRERWIPRPVEGARSS